MHDRITETDAMTFRKGEMVFKAAMQSGFKETLRGRIRLIFFHDVSSPTAGDEELPTEETQTIDVKFGWMVEERFVSKTETRSEVRRSMKCLGYRLENLEVVTSSIERGRNFLRFRTANGDLCTWFTRKHPERLRGRTLKFLLLERKHALEEEREVNLPGKNTLPQKA